MTQRTFYDYPWERPDDGDAPQGPPDDIHTVAHGYNLADIEHLARIAALRAFGGHGTYGDRHEHARAAVVEHLLTANSRPEAHELLHAGSRAVTDFAAKEERTDGYSRKRGETHPQFSRYWTWTAASSPSPEGPVVDRTALWQIWQALDDRWRAPLLALAATGDRAAAAEKLGITSNAMKIRLKRARAAFLALWHEGETPSQTWRPAMPSGRATDSRHGKARLTTAQVEQARARVWAGETYEAVGAELGVAKSTVGRFLRGERVPAPDDGDPR